MDEQTESSRTPQPSGTPTPNSARRPYAKPALIDYGTVASLTQGAGSAGGDRASPKKRLEP